MIYRSYAKINLYLDVLERRADGFHDLETIFQSVSLHDELHFESADEGIELVCSNPALDCGNSNLVMRAARAILAHCPEPRGVRIRLEKNVPMAAGLAGGSGNAAATLIALNELWDAGLDLDTLAQIGLDLGSDVPFCLVGGTVAATGRGEELLPIAPLPETWFVLLHPPFPMPTGSVFEHPALHKCGARGDRQYSEAFEGALRGWGRNPLSDLCYNAMESAAFAMRPELGPLKSRLAEAGCTAALMSGSGPTLFGICGSEEQAVQIAEQFPDVDRTIVCDVPVGVERID
jgi:4-diphosphocytidyl-2-C-methyl-D-erythritol kinase